MGGDKTLISTSSFASHLIIFSVLRPLTCLYLKWGNYVCNWHIRVLMLAIAEVEERLWA